MIGRAIVRESRLAWSREKPPPARRRQGDAVAGDAGRQRRGLRDPEHQAVGGTGLAPPAQLRAGVGDEHRGGAGEQAVGGRPRAAQAPLDLTLEAIADSGRGQEGEAEHDTAAQVEDAQLLGDHAPLADQQGERGAGVERHLEALAQLRVELLPVPAREPGEEDDVGGAGYGEQLGRALDESKRHGAPGGDPPLYPLAQAPSTPTGSAGPPSSGPPPRRRRRRTRA